MCTVLGVHPLVYYKVLQGVTSLVWCGCYVMMKPSWSSYIEGVNRSRHKEGWVYSVEDWCSQHNDAWCQTPASQ